MNKMVKSVVAVVAVCISAVVSLSVSAPFAGVREAKADAQSCVADCSATALECIGGCGSSDTCINKCSAANLRCLGRCH